MLLLLKSLRFLPFATGTAYEHLSLLSMHLGLCLLLNSGWLFTYTRYSCVFPLCLVWRSKYRSVNVRMLDRLTASQHWEMMSFRCRNEFHTYVRRYIICIPSTHVQHIRIQLHANMCELSVCVFPNPPLDMCPLMNLSFINILSKFNSNTFCLRCCYDDDDDDADDDIDIQSPPYHFLPHHLHSIHISTVFLYIYIKSYSHTGSLTLSLERARVVYV